MTGRESGYGGQLGVAAAVCDTSILLVSQTEDDRHDQAIADATLADWCKTVTFVDHVREADERRSSKRIGRQCMRP